MLRSFRIVIRTCTCRIFSSGLEDVSRVHGNTVHKVVVANTKQAIELCIVFCRNLLLGLVLDCKRSTAKRHGANGQRHHREHCLPGKRI
jgi:hypothetical protein